MNIKNLEAISKEIRINMVDMVAFSKSGTPDQLLKHYGLTKEKIIESTKTILENL